MKRRTLLSSLLAIGLLAWFLSRASLEEVWVQVREVPATPLIAGFACVAVSYWMRAVRWQYLLVPLGAVRFKAALHATIIGFAALGLLPARVGDVLKPYLLARREGLSVSATFATVVLERVLDLVAVLALLAAFVWGFSDDASLPPALRRSIEVSAALGGAGSVALLGLTWILASHPERIGMFVTKLTRVLPRRSGERLGHLAKTFSTGFAATRHPRALVAAVLWSFPLWVVVAAEAWFITRGFGIEMPFSGSFLLQALLVIGVAVPTPGAVGTFHEAYRIGVTTFFDAPNGAAVAAAIVLHAVSFLPVVVVGFVLMARDGLSVKGLQSLVGVAREEEMGGTDEVPVLRTSGR